MAAHPSVPDDVLAQLRLVCLDLPDAVEEPAWVGTRWCVRKKNFAHVLTINAGWPPAYAQAAACPGPACVLTFRCLRAQADATRFTQRPFFRPAWFPNIVGLMIDDGTDWDEVGALVAQSYCVLAPKRLAGLVDRVGR